MIAFSLPIHVGPHSLQGLMVNAPDPNHHSMEWLADYLYRQHSSDLAVATFVIVRPPVDQQMQEHYFRIHAFPSLRQRIPSLPIYLLGSQNFSHFLSGNLNPLANDPFEGSNTDELLAEVQQVELAMYATHSNALLTTTGSRYFRAPSMKYCQHFMRVGNIQTSRSAIDAVFFWLLPWFKDCSAIITESWTVSSTALNAARLLSRYDPHRHSRCRVDMFSAYHDNSLALHLEAEDILRRVLPLPTDKVLLLVSSCMSGNLIRQFKEVFHISGFESSRWRCGAIYSLGDQHSVPALCDATRFVPNGGFAFSETLPQDATVIEIDRRTYFPLRIEENKINLKKDETVKYRDFFNAYRKTNLFCVHRNCYEQRGRCSRYLRHHAVDLDLTAILAIDPFASRFSESVRKIAPTPRLIVTPPHQAGIRMAETAQGLLSASGAKVEILVHPDLKFSENDPWCDRFSRFEENDAILIIDDVSVTGSRMARFAQSLRALKFRGRIHFRVGIARPESEKRWKKVCGQLQFRLNGTEHTVEAIHEVVLPNWHRKKCPWCVEQRFYTESLSNLKPFDERLSKRLQRLNADEFSEPLITDIFLSDPSCPFPPLAGGSIFLDEGATQAALFAAAASLLQRMRVSEALPKMPPPNYPEISVIDPGNYLFDDDRFPEDSIRAAIMRGAMVHELQSPRNEDEVSRAEVATTAMLEESTVKPMILEIMLQSKLGKLPPLPLTAGQENFLKELYENTAGLLLSK
jgi:hypothetical protein